MSKRISAKKRHQGQQGKTENGGIVSVDRVEQLHTTALQSVSTDRTGNRVGFSRQIVLEELLAEVAHGETRPRDVVPDVAPILTAHDRRHQHVTAPAQRA